MYNKYTRKTWTLSKRRTIESNSTTHHTKNAPTLWDWHIKYIHTYRVYNCAIVYIFFISFFSMESPLVNRHMHLMHLRLLLLTLQRWGGQALEPSLQSSVWEQQQLQSRPRTTITMFSLAYRVLISEQPPMDNQLTDNMKRTPPPHWSHDKKRLQRYDSLTFADIHIALAKNVLYVDMNMKAGDMPWEQLLYQCSLGAGLMQGSLWLNWQLLRKQVW